MKPLKAIILFCVIFSFISTSASATGEFSWFCIRSGQCQPPKTKEEALINKYGGFSINRCKTDQDTDKVIYLTFDAGYENGNVARIIDAMNAEGAVGAFFLLDNIILKNPDLVTKMLDRGNLICNHTANHKNLAKCDKEEIIESISALERVSKEMLSIEIEKFFRFPEGRYSEDALRTVCELGYKSVFWSFAYADWDNTHQPNETAAIKKILNNTHNGAIFLFHPTSEVNAKIFPTLLSEWKKMGYRFGSLKEIEIKADI